MPVRIKTKDLIAALVIVFIFLFKWYGFDGTLDAVLAMILGYYFTKREAGIDPGL